MSLALALALFFAPAPEADVTHYLSPREIREFHDYRKPRWIRGLAETALEGAFLFFMTRFTRLRRLRAVPFACAFALLWSLLRLPSGVVFDWYLPRANGLSDQTLPRFLWLALLAALTQALGLAALAVGVFGLVRRVKHPALVLGIPAGIAVTFAGSLDPYAVLLRNQLTPLPPGAAQTAIEAIAPGVPIEVMDAGRDTRSLDAFVTGEGATRRIVLFDTLVKELPPREIAVVVAHELGHLGERRWRRAALAGICVPLLLALIFLVLRRSRYGPADHRSLPLAVLTVWIVLTIAAPLAHAYERDLELRADEFALVTTGDREAYLGAMLRIARNDKLDPVPPRVAVWLLYDHPTLAQRLGLYERYGNK